MFVENPHRSLLSPRAAATPAPPCSPAEGPEKFLVGGPPAFPPTPWAAAMRAAAGGLAAGCLLAVAAASAEGPQGFQGYCYLILRIRYLVSSNIFLFLAVSEFLESRDVETVPSNSILVLGVP